MDILERHLLIAAVTGVVSLMVLLVMTIFRVPPRTKARIVALVPNILFGGVLLVVIGFGLYFS